jgi:cation:H+ antiporter
MVMVGLSVVVGALLLGVAPDRFVAGSAGLAERWGLSRVVIGAVVIGFGTSTPELLVSGLAAAGQEPEVAVGNIVGSNMANLGLIVAVAALIGHLGVPRGLLRRELPLMIMATVAFAVAVQNGVSPVEGAALAAGLVAAMAVLIAGSRRQDRDESELEAEIDEFLVEEQTEPTPRLVAHTVIGLTGTLAGAQLLVTGAVRLAEDVGLSGGFVGLTIVALGTSLPELTTAVAAARVGEDQLILGNVLGSNLFNCLAVGAVVGLAGSGPLEDPSITVGAVSLMLVITALAAVAMNRRQIVTRGEAAVLLVTYTAFLPLLS